MLQQAFMMALLACECNLAEQYGDQGLFWLHASKCSFQDYSTGGNFSCEALGLRRLTAMLQQAFMMALLACECNLAEQNGTQGLFWLHASFAVFRISAQGAILVVKPWGSDG